MKRSVSVSILTVFGTALLVYYLTYARLPVNYADSLELITAAYTRGIAHPPGYPLYTFLLHFWMKMPFFSSPSQAANFLSTFIQSLSLIPFTFMGFELIRLFRPPLLKKVSYCIPIAGAFSLGFSTFFWQQALLAEVFPLLNLFTGSILWLGIKTSIEKDRKKKRKLALLLTALFGFSVAHHQTILFILPFLITACWPFLRNKPVEFAGKLSLVGVLSFLLPYLVFLPFFNPNAQLSWFYEPSVKGLWAFITRQLYTFEGSAIETYTGSFDLKHSLLSLLRYGEFLKQHFSVIGLSVGLLGLVKIKQNYPKFFMPLLVSLLLSGPVLAMYLKFPLPNTGDTEYFWGTALRLRMFTVHEYLFGLGLIPGLLLIAEKVYSYSKKLIFLRVSIFLLPLALLAFHFQPVSLRGANFDTAFFSKILHDLPPEAVVVVDSDQVFGLLHAQIVEHTRQDVVIIPATYQMRWGYLSQWTVPPFLTTYADRNRHIAQTVAWHLALNRRVFVLDPEPELFQLTGVQGDPFYVIPSGYLFEISRVSKPIPSYDYGLSHQLNTALLPDTDLWGKGTKGLLSTTHLLSGYFLTLAQATESAKIHYGLAWGLAQQHTGKDNVVALSHFPPPEVSYLTIPPAAVDDFIHSNQPVVFEKAVLLDPMNGRLRTRLMQMYLKEGSLEAFQEEEAALYHLTDFPSAGM